MNSTAPQTLQVSKRMTLCVSHKLWFVGLVAMGNHFLTPWSCGNCNNMTNNYSNHPAFSLCCVGATFLTSVEIVGDSKVSK